MNRDFWQARWDEGRIGFHQEQFNPHLQRYWSGLGVEAGATVFVPLCGKSRDMLWLRDQGYSVIGVEIVQRAAESFFAENGMIPISHEYGDFILYESEGIKIYQGDFFDLNGEDVAGISAVYDRASLIALPPIMRQRYVAHLSTILPGNRMVLLVTLDYPQVEMEGPPFAVTEKEVMALYHDSFEIVGVNSEDVLADNLRFQEQGISRLYEKVYVLRAR